MLQHVLAYDLNDNPHTGVITSVDRFANIVVLFNPKTKLFSKCLYDSVVYERPLQEKGESPFDAQEGGSHYKDMAIQPTDYILANGLGFCEGNIIKYITRYPFKDGIEDVKKAKHYCEILIANLETKYAVGNEKEDGANTGFQSTRTFGSLIEEIGADLDIDEFANNIAPHALNNEGIVTTGVDRDVIGESYKEQGDDLPDVSLEEEVAARRQAERDMELDGWGPILTPADLVGKAPVRKETVMWPHVTAGQTVQLADYISGLSPAFFSAVGVVKDVTNNGSVAWVKTEGSRTSLPIGVTDLRVIRPAA